MYIKDTLSICFKLHAIASDVYEKATWYMKSVNALKFSRNKSNMLTLI